MSYIIYKQGIVQGSIALVNGKIQCGPTMEMIWETEPETWERTRSSLNRLIDSMRLSGQSDSDLYASLGHRLHGFVYAIEQNKPVSKGATGK